eukprot:Lankesteria_metandrocarpae@DN8142_c0_g1_i1.p1
MGYGFADFISPDAAKFALEICRETPRPGHQRKFKACWATGKQGTKADNSSDVFSNQRGSLAAALDSDEPCIHVGGLETTVLEEELRHLFESRYPSTCSVRLARDGCGESRGFAFVRFKSRLEFFDALRMMQDVPMHGTGMRISIAQQQGNPCLRPSNQEEPRNNSSALISRVTDQDVELAVKAAEAVSAVLKGHRLTGRFAPTSTFANVEAQRGTICAELSAPFSAADMSIRLESQARLAADAESLQTALAEWQQVPCSSNASGQMIGPDMTCSYGLQDGQVAPMYSAGMAGAWAAWMAASGAQFANVAEQQSTRSTNRIGEHPESVLVKVEKQQGENNSDSKLRSLWVDLPSCGMSSLLLQNKNSLFAAENDEARLVSIFGVV